MEKKTTRHDAVYSAILWKNRVAKFYRGRRQERLIGIYPVIVTKYLGPKNCKGSRIRASAWYAPVFAETGYRYELSTLENHFLAVEKLYLKLCDLEFCEESLPTIWISGNLSPAQYVWTQIPTVILADGKCTTS